MQSLILLRITCAPIQVAADLLREQKRLTFEKMCEHPIHLNVNWEVRATAASCVAFGH